LPLSSNNKNLRDSGGKSVVRKSITNKSLTSSAHSSNKHPESIAKILMPSLTSERLFKIKTPIGGSRSKTPNLMSAHEHKTYQPSIRAFDSGEKKDDPYLSIDITHSKGSGCLL
jgi:hypothetical protein